MAADAAASQSDVGEGMRGPDPGRQRMARMLSDRRIAASQLSPIRSIDDDEQSRMTRSPASGGGASIAIGRENISHQTIVGFLLGPGLM